MLAHAAKAIARAWVREEGSATPGFAGAVFHGSINWLPDDAELPAASDIDILVVLDGPLPPNKLGKFRYRDVLIEVTYIKGAELGSPAEILGVSHLARSFGQGTIIADPTGRLAALQSVVAEEYARRPWVRRRCAHAEGKIVRFLEGIDPAAPLHAQVLSWLFATGVTTHVLLAAGLRNPTVRTRYLAARELLAEYGQLPFYTTLLELLGCADMPGTRAAEHLAALMPAFDAAAAVIATPVPFASDISAAARPIAIDASGAMIAIGDHREAVFWLVATYARCQTVLHQDAPPALRERHTPGFARLLADLGIESADDIRARAETLRAALPRVWEMAELIMGENPAIVD